MTLSQTEINKAAIIAALLVKDKTFQELSSLARELSIPRKRQEAVRTLCKMLADMRGEKIEDVNDELADEILKRIQNNIKLQFGTPEPPSSEWDSLCEVPDP